MTDYKRIDLRSMHIIVQSAQLWKSGSHIVVGAGINSLKSEHLNSAWLDLECLEKSMRLSWTSTSDSAFTAFPFTELPNRLLSANASSIAHKYVVVVYRSFISTR